VGFNDIGVNANVINQKIGKRNTIIKIMNKTQSTSLVRWAGSKKQLLPILEKFWCQTNSRYLEPFMGSASLFFRISPEIALLSDINFDLVNAFAKVKDSPKDIHDALVRLPALAESYYEIRSKSPNNMSDDERAVRFLYLNRYCFNGLYRTNLKGEFNVPFGGAGNRIPPLETFLTISERLKNVDLRCGNYFDIISDEVRSGDFVYLDPPYKLKNTKGFYQYGPNTFIEEDLVKIAELLKVIDSVGARFLLSYASSEDVMELFREWNISYVEVKRNISGFSKFRGPATELLIHNIPSK
jgi:DNA adenine methylase